MIIQAGLYRIDFTSPPKNCNCEASNPSQQRYNESWVVTIILTNCWVRPLLSAVSAPAKKRESALALFRAYNSQSKMNVFGSKTARLGPQFW